MPQANIRRTVKSVKFCVLSHKTRYRGVHCNRYRQLAELIRYLEGACLFRLIVKCTFTFIYAVLLTLAFILFIL